MRQNRSNCNYSLLRFKKKNNKDYNDRCSVTSASLVLLLFKYLNLMNINYSWKWSLNSFVLLFFTLCKQYQMIFLGSVFLFLICLARFHIDIYVCWAFPKLFKNHLTKNILKHMDSKSGLKNYNIVNFVSHSGTKSPVLMKLNILMPKLHYLTHSWHHSTKPIAFFTQSVFYYEASAPVT